MKQNIQKRNQSKFSPALARAHMRKIVGRVLGDAVEDDEAIVASKLDDAVLHYLLVQVAQHGGVCRSEKLKLLPHFGTRKDAGSRKTKSPALSQQKSRYLHQAIQRGFLTKEGNKRGTVYTLTTSGHSFLTSAQGVAA